MDRSNTLGEISFHGLPSKTKRRETDSIVVIITVNGIIVFTKQPSAERYLVNIFSPVFLWTFRKFLQRIKKKHVFLEIFRKFGKKHSCRSLKDAGFYRSSQRRCSVKKDVLRKVFAKLPGKQLCRKLYFNKVSDLGNSDTAVFAANLHIFYRTLPDDCFCF